MIFSQAIRDQCFGGSGDRSDANNVAIIITDGVPYPASRYQPAIDVAEQLRMESSKWNAEMKYSILVVGACISGKDGSEFNAIDI